MPGRRRRWAHKVGDKPKKLILIALAVSVIRLTPKRFERSEVLERLEPFGLLAVRHLMPNGKWRVGEN